MITKEIVDNGEFSHDDVYELIDRIAELDKERFTFKKIISNPAMADQEKYVHIRDMLKEQGE